MAKMKKCMVKGCNKPATETMLLIVYNSADPNYKTKVTYRYLCREHYEKELREI